MVKTFKKGRDGVWVAMVKKYLRIMLLLILSLPCFYVGYYFFVPDVARLKRWNPPRTSFMEYRLRSSGRKLQFLEGDSSGDRG